MLNESVSSTNAVQSYLTWLVNMPSGGIATIILILFLTLLVIFELCNPREIQSRKQLRQSYRANIKLFIFNSVVMSLLSVPALFIFAGHYSYIGLLNYLSSPVWKAVLSFFAMDLMLYFLHKASHSFNGLWILHRVHHSDPYLNVSTAFRIHFLEVVLINTLKAMLVVVLGIDGALLLANEAVITLFTMLHHANISFRGEQFLGRVIVTPYLHRVHHSTLRNEHDRNYGAVFSIWDRLFGTLAELKPTEIGVKDYSSQELINLITCGLMMGSSSPLAFNLDKMIAEAAYYKAEKRGFYPGNEFGDWLEAKKEIISLVYGQEQAKNKLKQKWQGWVESINDALNGRSQIYPLFRKLLN